MLFFSVELTLLLWRISAARIASLSADMRLQLNSASSATAARFDFSPSKPFCNRRRAEPLS